MSSAGAAPRAAVPISSARTEASRRNGARSRGPTTSEGKARSAQNALKHGMRALKYVVLPDESAAEFQALEAANGRRAGAGGRAADPARATDEIAGPTGAVRMVGAPRAGASPGGSFRRSRCPWSRPA
jgi:hypothetical protein